VKTRYLFENCDGLDRRLERPRIAARGVMTLRLPMVETYRDGEDSCGCEVAGQGRGQSHAGSEEFDSHIRGSMSGDVDYVSVEERLPPSEA
jgi:hypothetical protein